MGAPQINVSHELRCKNPQKKLSNQIQKYKKSIIHQKKGDL